VRGRWSSRIASRGYDLRCVSSAKERYQLLLFQDGGAFFVGEDGAFEFAERRSLVGWNFDLADNIFALVVEAVVLSGEGGVVAGEVHVDVDGVGGLIYDVTGRQRDVEGVVPMTGGA